MKFKLTQALCLLLPTAGTAAEFDVTQSTDDGSGSIANTLSWAILQANNSPGVDSITLNSDVSVEGVMQRLINSDVTIRSDQTHRTIDGNDMFRPLFIKSGSVTIENLTITRGRAEGGDGAAAGAGLGGALFLYDGELNISDVTIENSTAVGGQGTSNSIGYDDGGGGMFRNAIASGGGNLLGTQPSAAYQDNDPRFGLGAGNATDSGGFGGGGAGSAYAGTHGGFGGGGGSCYCAYGGSAGRGGFGAASGVNYYTGSFTDGFGAAYGDGAGLGGAIFVRSGSLDMKNIEFNNNEATGDASQGLGGALFVIHTLSNTNGNNSGMPASLPIVTGCEVTFVNNLATSDTGSSNNNDDVFDLADRINQDSGILLTSTCEDLIFSDGFE